MSDKHILIVDDDLSFLNMLEVFLEKNGFHTAVFTRPTQALHALEKQKFDLVLTDYRMPEMDGMLFLEKARRMQAGLPVVMMTSYGEIQLAVKAMQLGASNYLTKPVDAHELLQLIQHLLAPHKARKTEPGHSAERQFGTAPFWSAIRNRMERVARTDIAVFIRGESGVGKEFIAQWIHQHSPRKDGPFVAVDCGSLTEELFPSELFGHIKGSFTGAVQDKTGFLEAAHGGTLFLDEVGNLSLNAQKLLLRSLQEKRFRKVGGTKEQTSDFRIVAATNLAMETAIHENEFRLDLYHRINEVDLHIPPLRERVEDILFYANIFASQAAEELQTPFSGFAASAVDALNRYPWPGNLRELKNVVKKTLLFASSSTIEREDLPLELRQTREESATEGLDLNAREKQAIQEALDRAGQNKAKAARLLNIDRKTLYNKLRRYRLS